MTSDITRQITIMVDYLFGRGVGNALPREGFRLFYSQRSGRVKLIHHDGKLFATIKPNGSMALSIYGATLLSKSPRFMDNCIRISDDVVQFVKGGRSVFNKFVVSAGRNVFPKSEVAVIDGRGRVVGVGMAVLNGAYMTQFKTGVAVKVRAGLGK